MSSQGVIEGCGLFVCRVRQIYLHPGLRYLYFMLIPVRFGLGAQVNGIESAIDLSPFELVTHLVRIEIPEVFQCTLISRRRIYATCQGKTCTGLPLASWLGKAYMLVFDRAWVAGSK